MLRVRVVLTSMMHNQMRCTGQRARQGSVVRRALCVFELRRSFMNRCVRLRAARGADAHQ